MPQGLKILKFLLLYPISLIYGLVVSTRNFFYDTNIIKSKSYYFPVISIGNLTVGGTGKTPHVEYIAGLLKNDFNIAILSRGYKRKTRGFRIANSDDDASVIGDEPMQMKERFPGITVAVDEKRSRGIEILCKEDELNAIVMDDAFQHRRVKAGLNILLSDYHRPFTKDHYLPYGRLRESPHEHRRAHIIIITKCPAEMKPIEKRIMEKELKIYPFQYLYFTRFEYGDLVPVFENTGLKKIPLNQFDSRDKSILGVSGIAHNRGFARKLKSLSKQVKLLRYADHHYYSEKNMKRIADAFEKQKGDEKYIITTRKDAVKIKMLKNVPDSLKNHLFYLPVDVKFIGSKQQEDEFKYHIIRYVKTNRRYSKLYKGQDHLRT